jgi:hypothetical protein
MSMAQKCDDPDMLQHAPQTERVLALKVHMEANPTPWRIRSLRAKRAYKERMERLKAKCDQGGKE